MEEKVVPWSSTWPPVATSFSNTEESPSRLSDTDGGTSQSRTVFSSKRVEVLFLSLLTVSLNYMKED